MQWEDRQESENVDDRRRMSGGARAALGGAGGIIVLLLAYFLGVDPRLVQNLVNIAAPQVQQDDGKGQQRPIDPKEERQAKFSKVIFHDTEEIWNELFRKIGRRYQEPRLVLFSGFVESACGGADSAVGPFYCPGDKMVYIDLSFYNDMERKLNAPGEFARAYVIAHEVGHHVQNLLGYSAKVNEVRARGNKVESNRASVRLELQADFLAGVWAHHGQKKYNFLDPGDMESALNAAFEIGDDRLQKKARGTVVPDAFTHGTSKQRMRWFQEGFKTGDVQRAELLFSLPYDQL